MAGVMLWGPGSEGEPVSLGEQGDRVAEDAALREELERRGGEGTASGRGEEHEDAERDRVRMRPGSETTGTAFTLQLQKGHLALPSRRCCIGNCISPPKAHNFSHTMRPPDKPKLRDRLESSSQVPLTAVITGRVKETVRTMRSLRGHEYRPQGILDGILGQKKDMW